MNFILHHASGRRSYRRVFPDELRPFIPDGRREHKVSLGHPSDAGFLSRYEKAAAEYDSAVANARKRQQGAFDPLDAPRIAYLAELFRVQSLAEDEEGRYCTQERDLFLQVQAQLEAGGVACHSGWSDGPLRRWAGKSRQTIDFMLPHYRDLRAIGDIDGIVDLWRGEALLLCEAADLVIDERAEEPMRRLCRALNDATISASEDKLRRLNGEDVPTPAEPVGVRPEDRKVSTVSPVPLLPLFEGYAVAQGLTPGVRDEWRRYIERLIGFLRHDDASRLTTGQLLDWRDKLLAEPSRKGTPRDPSTVRDKYVTAIRATLAWAVEERKLPNNVAADVVVRVPKKAKLRDRDFTEAEAQAILTATLLPCSLRLSSCYARARRWIPWLCAYTGGRVNEFSQLRGEDVQQIEGIWVVRITPDAGTVKTKETRLVPVHEHLIEQGFLKVAQANGHGPLFYDPTQQRVEGDGNRHFKKVGERLAAWVRKEVGITDPAIQPNHAWRHTFKSLSYLVGIEERMVDAIQGHAPSTTGRRYGKVPLRAMAEAIGKLPRFQVEGV